MKAILTTDSHTFTELFSFKVIPGESLHQTLRTFGSGEAAYYSVSKKITVDYCAFSSSSQLQVDAEGTLVTDTDQQYQIKIAELPTKETKDSYIATTSRSKSVNSGTFSYLYEKHIKKSQKDKSS